MTPRISVLIYTARGDHPYIDRPDMHCFEPVVETLAQQTFTDFELVIADALYEDRAGYFTNQQRAFPIKHVPTSPNLWHEKGRPGLCAQLNRGLAWCDGVLVWIGAENNLFPPHHLQTAWDIFSAGRIPVAWYAILDREHPPDERATLERSHWRYPPVAFNLCGWTEKLIYDVDHRADRFADPETPELSPCHHQHYFAYAGLPLDLAYALNGFDEALDGDLSAIDVDMGSRICMLRGDGALAMHRNLWVMEPPTSTQWNPKIQRYEMLKCGYALWWYNRLTNRRVNTPQPEGWIDEAKKRVCGGCCPIRDKCASGDPGTCERYLYPICEGPEKELTRFWLNNLPVRDLATDAETRRRGEHPFDRCTRGKIG